MFEGWQLELVQACRVAHLGTIARAGEPHLAPVCFALVNGRFAIAIDEKPKRGGKLARVTNIERDGRVTLLFDRYSEEWNQLAWVRVHGSATVIDRGDREPLLLGALRARYHQYRAMNLESRPLIVISPDRIVAWRWTEG